MKKEKENIEVKQVLAEHVTPEPKVQEGEQPKDEQPIEMAKPKIDFDLHPDLDLEKLTQDEIDFCDLMIDQEILICRGLAIFGPLQIEKMHLYDKKKKIEKALFFLYEEHPTAVQNHNHWIELMEKAGWTKDEFDLEKKTHPMLGPWENLPEMYKKKTELYAILANAFAKNYR